MTPGAVEKRPLTFMLFFLRLFSGAAGGIAGLLALFVTYFLLISLVPSREETTSISIFVVMVMAFVGTITANTVTAAMSTFMDSVKYSRRKTIVSHVFLFNLVLFFLAIPLYLIGIPLDIGIGIAAVHFLLSAFISSIIMEFLAGYEYALLGLYGSALGIFISIAVALLALMLKMPPLALLFTAMPAVWLILELVSAFAELIYDTFVRLYGMDPLNASTDLGGDAEVEPEEKEEGKEE